MTLILENGVRLIFYTFSAIVFFQSCGLKIPGDTKEMYHSFGYYTTFVDKKNKLQMLSPGSNFRISAARQLPSSIRRMYKMESKSSLLKGVLMDTSLAPNILFRAVWETKHFKDSLDYSKLLSQDSIVYFIEKQTNITSDSIYWISVIVPVKKDKYLKFLCSNIKSHAYNVKNSRYYYSPDFFWIVTDSYFKSLKNLMPQDINEFSINAAYFDLINERKGDYSGILSFLNTKRPSLKESDRFVFYEFLINEYSFRNSLDSVKKYISVQDKYSLSPRKEKSLSDSTLRKMKQQIVDAGSFLNEIAKADIFLINESHFDWRNRYFISTLLGKLKEAGYTKIGFEALNDTAINTRGFPLQTSGYYVKEPYMANLIRAAFHYGFNIFCYDNAIDNNREYNQAENIRRIYCQDERKTIVVAGYGHIYKKAFGNSNTMLMNLTSMLPTTRFLTVDQVRYNDLFYKEWNRDRFGKELVYYIKEGEFTDFSIYSTINSEVYYTPTACSIDISSFLQNIDEKFDLLVYIKKEYEKYDKLAVPIVIRKITNLPSSFLTLPQNTYLLQIMDSANKVIKQVDVTSGCVRQ